MCYSTFRQFFELHLETATPNKEVMMKFLLSGASLFPLPYQEILKIARSAGFDGVEFFLFGGVFGWTDRKVNDCLARARKLGLIVHFHQAWNMEETTEKSLVQEAMAQVGLLYNRQYALSEHIPASLQDSNVPIVVYAERYIEAIGQQNLWLQTISLCREQNGRKEYRLSFAEFEGMFRQGRITSRIALDNQHILEWKSGKIGVQHISPTKDALLEELLPLVSLLRNSIAEIHFNDCDPRRGVGARNLFPGDGVMPLEELADEVKKSVWGEVVVPEVSTLIMMRDPWRNPLKLRRKMAEIWGG